MKTADQGKGFKINPDLTSLEIKKLEAHQYFLNHVFLPGNCPEMCLLLPEIESNTCPAKELKVLKDGITFLI